MVRVLPCLIRPGTGRIADHLTYDARTADEFTTLTMEVSASTGKASLIRRKVARAWPTI
jgi:hypothetical protein